MRIGQRGFQMFFEAAAATGAGAAAPVVDDAAKAAAAAVVPPVVDDKAAADTVAADKVAADKVAADKVATDKVAADAAAAAEAAKNETPEQKVAREAAEAKAKVPAKYELKVGKDAATFIDDADLKTLEAFARDKGLTNEQAQILVDARATALLEQSVAFRAITEADPVYGGDKLAETERLAKLTLDKIRPAGTPRGEAFRKILAKTGYGNNLEIVSLLADLGKSLTEDEPGGLGGSAAHGKTDAASKLYDHPTSKST